MSGSAVGIVLAAGASRRMGSPKPLLPLEGATYVERVVARLRDAGLPEVLVVLGHGADRIVESVDLEAAKVVRNPGWRRGMLSSLQVGLDRALDHARRGGADPDAAVVAPVDVPRFAVSTVRALLRARTRMAAPVVVPEHAGRHGHPVLFGREVWEELGRPHPELGARAVVEAHRQELVSVPVDDPWVLRDADTPADHERMLAGDPGTSTG